MELNTEEYFLLLFAFNLTMALLLHLSEIHTLPHIYIFFVGHSILSFYHHLLPTSLFSCSLHSTFPFCSHSLFDHLCFLPIISSISSFSLSHIFFSPHFCLFLIFVLVINHPPHTTLANSSYISFPLLP